MKSQQLPTLTAQKQPHTTVCLHCPHVALTLSVSKQEHVWQTTSPVRLWWALPPPALKAQLPSPTPRVPGPQQLQERGEKTNSCGCILQPAPSKSPHSPPGLLLLSALRVGQGPGRLQ